MADVFVGRAGPLVRLTSVLDDTMVGRAHLALVTGEAGIGKTSLLSRIAEVASQRGALVAWGTSWDSPSAPAFWLWTQVLRGMATRGATAPSGIDAAELGRLVPELGSSDAAGESSDDASARFRLFDAVTRHIERAAVEQPLVVVLDDLQWADTSSLLLLDFLVRPHRPVPVLVLGAYRHNELRPDARELLGGIASCAAAVHLEGFTVEEVRALLAATTSIDVADRRAGELQRRTSGHPFFVRELAHQIAEGSASAQVPGAVRDAVRARLGRLDPTAVPLVEVAAVAGGVAGIDALAEVCGISTATTAALVGSAIEAGVLIRHSDGSVGFAHDLLRETIEAALSSSDRLRLHQRIGAVLETRAGAEPGEVARHLTEAIPLDGPERAVHWATAASEADRRRLAFSEAASHLRRVREAIAPIHTSAHNEATLIDLLVAEGDLIGRAGQPEAARILLEDARAHARRLGDARRLASVALGVQHLGARFAMPRDDTIAVLEEARAAVAGQDPRLHIQLTAYVARELHHSVPAQRPRAGPLSEEALGKARELDDPVTLSDCLLARHDVLWNTGLGDERVEVGRELLAVAERLGDPERRCEALLLVANALLETGSAAFRPLLTEYVRSAEPLGPRHAYYALTRRAMLSLLDGDLDVADQLITKAFERGESIGEPDAGNVRMSQTLELVRSRGEPEWLVATADEAVHWWVGVPSHAYAVAAGFSARAGDLAAARRYLDVVVELDQWRDDRSYLWGVFVGQLATAAVAIDDRRLAEAALAELAPVADACTVNGAAVCFMGANAHWAGVLCAALDHPADAKDYLALALAIHERLDARVWVAETSLELAMLLGPDRGRAHADRARALANELNLSGVSARLDNAARVAHPDAALIRQGPMWELRYQGHLVHLPDAKGLHDLAVLVARPGVDVHVLELTAGRVNETDGPAVLDERAKREYRKRLADLDTELEQAEANHDPARQDQVAAERDALQDEMRRATGLGGRDRLLGSSEAERARKAVAARLRDTIGRITRAIPELGAHLDRSVATGMYCQYRPDGAMRWDVHHTYAETPPLPR